MIFFESPRRETTFDVRSGSQLKVDVRSGSQTTFDVRSGSQLKVDVRSGSQLKVDMRSERDVFRYEFLSEITCKVSARLRPQYYRGVFVSFSVLDELRPYKWWGGE